MRLWAVQLRVLYPSGRRLTIADPQIFIEAEGRDEAQQKAVQWFRMGNDDSVPLPVEIEVCALVEIGLENIWVFNDDRFRLARYNFANQPPT